MLFYLTSARVNRENILSWNSFICTRCEQCYPSIQDFSHHDLATANFLHLKTHDFLKTNSLRALDQPSKWTATFKASTSIQQRDRSWEPSVSNTSIRGAFLEIKKGVGEVVNSWSGSWGWSARNTPLSNPSGAHTGIARSSEEQVLNLGVQSQLCKHLSAARCMPATTC